MNTFFKRYIKNSIVTSIFLIILSIFLIFKPVNSLTFMMIFLGIIVISNGFIHTVSYFATPDELKSYSFELLEGIVCMIIGLFFILSPKVITSIFPIIIGFWIIIQSILKLQLSFNLKSIKNSEWVTIFFLCVLTFVIGLIIFLNPFTTVVTITSFVGIILLISETINLIEAFFVLKKI